MTRLLLNRAVSYSKFMTMPLAPGAVPVAGYRLVVNPPARLRKRAHCTSLLREHLSEVVYKTVLKRFPEEDGRVLYFEVSSLDHETTLGAKLGALGTFSRIPEMDWSRRHAADLALAENARARESALVGVISVTERLLKLRGEGGSEQAKRKFAEDLALALNLGATVTSSGLRVKSVRREADAENAEESEDPE